LDDAAHATSTNMNRDAPRSCDTQTAEREGEAGDAPAEGEHIDTLTPYDAEL